MRSRSVYLNQIPNLLKLIGPGQVPLLQLMEKEPEKNRIANAPFAMTATVRIPTRSFFVTAVILLSTKNVTVSHSYLRVNGFAENASLSAVVFQYVYLSEICLIY